MATNEERSLAPRRLYERREDLQCKHLNMPIVDNVIDLCGDTSEGESESGIECLCCFGEFPFEKMAQCCDGHLVCSDCLANYTTHQIYGPFKLELQCMEEDCSSFYPRSELARCLPVGTVEKWDERVQEENLKLSQLELKRCPHCHFACVLSPTVKVFRCQRFTCLKSTCKECGLDWATHVGKECEEVEQKDETTIRKEFEEKMTKATVRACLKCGTNFYKDEGCNKIRCQCGNTICYICRESEIAYSHFCTHYHSPGKKCTKCDKCYLWTSPKEDDERAILELKKEGNKRRRDLGFDLDKPIGVPHKKDAKKT